MIDAKSRAMSGAQSSRLRIDGGRVLVGDRLETTSISLDGELIADVGRDGGARRSLDADGLMVLPGIIDIHGDAFERQMMPRPGVHFPLDVALLDTDRQVIANGITTVFHGVTWSWEPGLRGPENARALVAAIETLRPHLHADTRFHLRHETYNLDAEAEVMEWIDAGAHRNAGVQQSRARSQFVATHQDRADGGTLRSAARPVHRAGTAGDRPGRRGAGTRSGALAARGRAHAVPMLSHDDAEPGGAAPVPRARVPCRRVSDHHRDGAGGRRGGRRDRARRAQRGAGWQPHRHGSTRPT